MGNQKDLPIFALSELLKSSSKSWASAKKVQSAGHCFQGLQLHCILLIALETRLLICMDRARDMEEK